MAKKGLVRIIFAILGIVSGTSIFGTFLKYSNYHAAIWGLVSAIFASIVLRLHIVYRRNKLHSVFTPESLQRNQYFGGIASLVTIIFSITYFTLAAVYKQGYQMKDDGYMPAGIFSLLALKWTVALLLYSRSYCKIVIAETAPMAKTAYALP